MDPKLKEVILRAMSALDMAKSPYAIGGAIALHSHGIVRETKDLDVFLKDDDIHKIFTAMRKEGFDIVQWGNQYHFAAVLPKYKRYLPDYRVDLLVTAIPAELSAITSPVKVKFIGRRGKFFPATELAASKFLAGDTKNLNDVVSIIQYGLTTPHDIHRSISSVTDADASEFNVWWSSVRSDLIAQAAKKRRFGR